MQVLWGSFLCGLKLLVGMVGGATRRAGRDGGRLRSVCARMFLSEEDLRITAWGRLLVSLGSCTGMDNFFVFPWMMGPPLRLLRLFDFCMACGDPTWCSLLS